MEVIEDLNYDCNYSLFLALYHMKTTLSTDAERKRVTDWINKVMKCNKTMSDLRLRNDFMVSLAMNVKNGDLRPPFDQDPGRGSLRTLAKQLPELEEAAMREDEDFLLLRFLPADRGGFLIPKPAPQIGAYCYLAAVNNN